MIVNLVITLDIGIFNIDHVLSSQINLINFLRNYVYLSSNQILLGRLDGLTLNKLIIYEFLPRNLSIIAGKYIFSIHESIDPSTSNEPTLICIFADPMWLFIENFAFIDSSWENYPIFWQFWVIYVFSVFLFFCTLIFHFLHWLILYFLHWWRNILQRKTQL